MLALWQLDDGLTCLAVGNRVPVSAQFVDDALGTYRQVDVNVGQALARVFESGAPSAGYGPVHGDEGDGALGRRPGHEPREREPDPQVVCPEVEAAHRPACNLAASVRLDGERPP
jgi:hypothetical protein